MKLPTQRSLDRLRKEGWVPAVVEKFNQHAQVRQDLFGIIDILAIRVGCRFTLGVQACSSDSVAKHVAKILAEPRTKTWLHEESGRLLQVWGWARRGARGEAKKWTRRRVSIRCVAGELVAQNLPEFDR